MAINESEIHLPCNITSDEPHLNITCQSIITLTYSLGIIGNCLALYTLYRGEYKNGKNKSILMLRCLAMNDLVALVGMSIAMNLQLYFKHFSHTYWFCVVRVILRSFGLGSGCVAMVMAIERWLALTKPFIFRMYITYKVLKRAVIVVWLLGTVLTCLPFAGFGLFYKDNDCKPRCERYRFATETKDIAYAYIYFTFGILLCVCIVFCNLEVMKELARIGKHTPVRRISRSLSRISNNTATQYNPTTEELAFAKLMAVLSISFVICWLPQMIFIPLAQYELGKKDNISRKYYYRIADILMSVHFTLDPFIYVLLRFKKNRPPKHSVLQPLSTGAQTVNTKLSHDVIC